MQAIVSITHKAKSLSCTINLYLPLGALIVSTMLIFINDCGALQVSVVVADQVLVLASNIYTSLNKLTSSKNWEDRLTLVLTALTSLLLRVEVVLRDLCSQCSDYLFECLILLLES
jgi:hypothetical protein